MRISTIVLFALCMASCSTGGYLPPVSTAMGPASPPTTAINTSWQEHLPHAYTSDTGRMRAAYTNPLVGGTMFFEVVLANQYIGVTGFVVSACERLADAHSGSKCTAVLESKDSRQGNGLILPANRRSSGALFVVPESRKEGAIMVYRILGDRERYMVCTGTWTLYKNAKESMFVQRVAHVDRLSTLCRLYSGY